MRVRGILEKFGFTKTEIAAILFLSVTFCAGYGVRWYRLTFPTKPDVPAFDYGALDSEFVARARASLHSFPPSGETQQNVHTTPAAPIDLNSASFDQLVALPGIGETTARTILRYRSEHGRIRAVEELLEVKGIGPKKLQKLRPFVRVSVP